MPRSKHQHLKEDFLDRLPVRYQHMLALALLFLMPVILFYSTVLGGEQFMGHDTIQWRASAESIFDYRAQHDGEEPLWSTHLFAGMPAYVIHVSKSVPHLDNVLFDQLRMIWPAVPYWILLGGAYFFFILQGFRPLTAALGSVFISFTTYIPIIIGAGHNIKFIAYSYIPWMLSGYWLLTRTDRRWLGFFLFAVATTLEFRAGHPQVTYYFIYLFGMLFLFDSWRYYKKKNLSDWWKITGFISAATLLALLGTAEQYLRLFEYSSHSIRGGSAIADISSQSGLSLEYAFSWSQGLLETFTLWIPNLFGGDSGLAYWGEKPVTSGPHYLGAITGILFLIALFRCRKRIVWIFLATGFLTMTFSWGSHFFLNELWFRIIPGFDKFRTPEMWLIVTTFCFSTVAIYGLQEAFSLLKEGRKGMKKLWQPAGVALGLGVLFLMPGDLILSYERPQEREAIVQQIANQSNLSPDNRQVQQRANQIIETQIKPERRQIARTDTFRYLFLTVVVAVLFYLCLNGTIGSGTLVLGLVLLAAFDMLSVGNRYISDQALIPSNYETTEIIESQRRPVDLYLQEQAQTPEGFEWRVLPLDDNPFNNAIPNYFYPTIGGYSGAKLSVIQDVIGEGLFTGPAGINFAMLNMLNVRYISAQRQLPLNGFQEVFQEGESFVYENQNVLPKAWFVDQVTVVDSPRDAFNSILPDQMFDPATEAVVETSSDISTVQDTTASVRIRNYTARDIVIEIERSMPGFLVLSEIYYPAGWRATLNGEEIPIYKTNYLLRGFEIPPGGHTLALTFQPASHLIGSKISWAANLIQWLIGLLLLAGWWRGWLENRQAGS
ncbi:MAG: YfhO family protein [Balneolaceae bacterium]